MSQMVQNVAAAIWRAREEELPPRVRRMEPDELDRSTGAWKHVENLARAAIGAMKNPPDDVVKAIESEAAQYAMTAPEAASGSDIWNAGVRAALAP